MVRRHKPRFVVEVGVYLGKTTTDLAKALDASGAGPDALVLAVDTWLGDAYMWGSKRRGRCEHCPTSYFESLRTDLGGFPLLYYQFLWNLRSAGVAHRVAPRQRSQRRAPSGATATASHESSTAGRPDLALSARAGRCRGAR